MLEALWSVEFASSVPGGVGAGVAVLETGRVLGGDGNYFYVGEYKVKDGVATATIKVQHYAGAPHSIFGQAKKFNLRLSGKINHDTFELRGSVVEQPGLQITMRLTRRAELP